jgi:hypothetical protein
MLTWSLDRLDDERPLTEHDVARAHIAAPHVLASWEARDAAYWRSVFLGLMVGATFPVLGCVVLGWTSGPLLLVVVLDVLVLVFCDAIKGLLAAQRAAQERAHQDEAAEVLAVIAALRRPRRPRHPDLFAERARPQYYLGLRRPRVDLPWTRWAATLFAGMFLALFFVVIGTWFHELFHWFVAAALFRTGISVFRTVRARRISAWRPELLPESPAPFVALGAVCFIGYIAFEVAGDWMLSLPPQGLGFMTLCLYFAVVLALAWVGMRQVRSVATTLRDFAARDRESLKLKVRQVNGKGDGGG